MKCYLKWDFRTTTVQLSILNLFLHTNITLWSGYRSVLECDIKAAILRTAASTRKGMIEYAVEKSTGTQAGALLATWMGCFSACQRSQYSNRTVCRLHRRHQSQNDRDLVGVGAVAAAVLVDHELLEGVEVRWDEGADGLVVVVEDLLPSALWAHRAGRPGQAGVRGAVTLVETDRPQSYHSGEHSVHQEFWGLFIKIINSYREVNYGELIFGVKFVLFFFIPSELSCISMENLSSIIQKKKNPAI